MQPSWTAAPLHSRLLVTVPLVFRTFCSSAEGLPSPGCLSQPRLCLILACFYETSWVSRITGPLPHYSVSCCLRCSNHPRGGASVWYISECFLSLSRLLKRSLIPSPSLFSPRKVPRCSTLVQSLPTCFFFFISPWGPYTVLFHLCVQRQTKVLLYMLPGWIQTFPFICGLSGCFSDPF